MNPAIQTLLTINFPSPFCILKTTDIDLKNKENWNAILKRAAIKARRKNFLEKSAPLKYCEIRNKIREILFSKDWKKKEPIEFQPLIDIIIFSWYITVAFQAAPLLAAFAHPDHLLLRRLTGLRSLAAEVKLEILWILE